MWLAEHSVEFTPSKRQKTGPGDGLMTSGSKPLPAQMLTKTHNAIWHLKATVKISMTFCWSWISDIISRGPRWSAAILLTTSYELFILSEPGCNGNGFCYANGWLLPGRLETVTQSLPGGFRTVSGVWDKAGGAICVMGWFKYRLGIGYICTGF